MSEQKSISVFSLLKRLWFHIGKRRRVQFTFLMGLTIISAFTEVVSIGAVLPFLSILIDPEKIFHHPLIHDFAQILGVNSAQQLVLPLTVTFVIISLISGGIRLLLLWANTKFAFASGADLSAEVYRKTLYQPYTAHLSRNSSEVVSGIVNKVNGVVFWVMLPALTFISSLILFIFIVLTLLIINPMVAVTAIVGFGLSYGAITWLSRRRLKQNGVRITHEQTQVIKALQEGLGGIRDVLLDGTQAIYCDIYRRADRPLRQAYGNNIFLGGSPRFAMEALGAALIASLAYFLSLKAEGIASALPMLGALALGAQRILPAMQQAYSSWASITGSYSSLLDTISLLDQPLADSVLEPTPAPLPFNHSISFCNVRFRYSTDGPWVLNGLNLKINKGKRIGIVGGSGSGKSTAADVLMGLLQPTEGILLIDDEPCIGSRIRAWQKTIAHVPQSIYLADSTLLENIAFGVPRELIDEKRVRDAAKQAKISEFIESRHGGYEAMVGENGIRLSGGQRQRIGIARALYKQAKVLIFDEATSALDHSTEQSVMDAINSLDRDLTLIIIAHRTTTLSLCDMVFRLNHGLITDQGSYSEMFFPENLP